MTKKALAAICLSAVLAMWVIHFATNHIQQFGSIQGHTVPATEGPSAMVRSLRPNYPYSVIAGGAYSPRELEFAHANDPVIRAHYADFDMKQAKLVTLTDDRYQYVSYRVKEQVYWTKKKLRIPKGELLLTDGRNFARTRCGNRLSTTPQNAVRLHEPDPPLLSLPPVNVNMLPKLALADAPALGDMPTNKLLPSQASSGAVPPVDGTPFPVLSQPVVPLEPIWGGQPITGGGVVPGSPILSSGGNPGAPVSPIFPGTSAKPLNPTGQVVPGAPQPNPVPEPNTIYLFLFSLGLSIWGLMRMTPKDEPEK